MRKPIDPIYLSGILTIAAVGFAGILSIETVIERWLALGALILLAVLVSRPAESVEKASALELAGLVAVQTGLVSLLIFLSSDSFVFSILFFVLSVEVMQIYSGRVASVWISLFIIINTIAFVSSRGWIEGLGLTLPFAAGYFFFGAFASALTRARKAQNESQRLLLELRTAHRRLQEYAGEVEALAVAEERNRMAREMHDTIGHRLTVSSVQLEGAQRLIVRDPERATRMVETVREQVRSALQELRQAVAALHEPLEAGLPLPVALSRLTSAFSESTGLPVHVSLPETLPELSASQRQALYRAAQEGLTNVQRHAIATQAWLALESSPIGLTLTVEDDGAGLRASAGTPGFGLSGMQERATRLGGTMMLSTRPEGGTRLCFSIPLLDGEQP